MTQKMQTLSLFARREPTTDAISLAHGRGNMKDVVLYRTPEATEPVARFGWFQNGCPTRRFKKVTLNCFRYNLVWLAAA